MPAPHAKNIVICSDGTGNSTIKGRGTNVFKLFEAVDVNGHREHPTLRRQIAFYDDGVGTQKIKWLRMLCGAFGFGLSRNVRQLYSELARVYTPGDAIYLFGFSRGAFTVRTLAGLIATCGIVDAGGCETEANLRRHVRRAYRAYRRKYAAWLTRAFRWMLPQYGPAEFCSQCPVHPPVARDADDDAEGVRIRFIGVWDTVDAVGLPFGLGDLWNRMVWRFKFNDQRLSHVITEGVQALALDEQRAEFRPVLWDESTPIRGQRVEQVWFAGAHSNVGGGYPQQGMSLVALDWMMEKAERADLRFGPHGRVQYAEQQSVADKLYDPRSGIGVFYRWRPRDVTALSRACGIAVPKIHVSAFDRIAQGVAGYAPGNIPPRCEAVATEKYPCIRLEAVEQAVRETYGGLGAPIAATAHHWIWVGFASYLIFIGGLLGAIGFASPALWAAMRVRVTDGGAADLVEGLLGVIGTLPADAASAVFQNHLARHVLEAGLAIGYILDFVSDRKIERRYSGFWHHGRRRLRDALSRTQAVAEVAGGRA